MSYIHAHGEKRSAHGSADFGAPRFATTDPELAPSLTEVQREIDKWIDENTGVGCNSSCYASASCGVTRNDGEFLSLACTHEFDYADWRSGNNRTSFLYRRQGKRFAPMPLQALARDPSASLLFRIIPLAKIDADVPVDDEKDLPGFYVALHDDAFEVGTALMFDPTPRTFRSFASVGHHLACDALLDMPSTPPTTPPAETGAIAVATHIVEDDDPLIVSYWGGRVSTIEYPVFRALEPRHAAAAQMLNAEVEGFLAKLRERAKVEQWGNMDAHCHAYSSTNRLVSVLCYGGGNTRDDKTRTARASINVRLTDPPERITADDIFAPKPSAPAQIAKHCLGRLVHKAKDEYDKVLPALPRLKAADLPDFGLWQAGAMFAVEYDLEGQRQLMPCYVPNDLLGTNLEMLSLPAKKKR